MTDATRVFLNKILQGRTEKPVVGLFVSLLALV